MTASGGDDLHVLALGTYDARVHPRVRVLIDGLRSHGVEISEANVPLGLTTAERVRVLQRPWLVPGLVLRLLRCWSRLVPLALRVRRRSRVDAVLVGYLGHFDVVLARLLFPRTRIVLDHLVSAAGTAQDRGAAGRLRGAALRALDALATRCADVVVVDTVEHRDILPTAARERAVVVPVGADSSWFRAGETRRTTTADGALSVIFFGLMTPLQGAVHVAEALRLLEGEVQATIVGSGQDGARVTATLDGVAGVRTIPWVDPRDLPDLVAQHDVCLGIFGTSDKAHRVVPNKVYQGAAAGCAVVTSDTAPQRRALGPAAILVAAGDADALAHALRALAHDRARVGRLQDEARRRVLDSFTPARSVDELVRRLGVRA